MISDVVIAILIGCGLFVGFAWAIVSFADEAARDRDQLADQLEEMLLPAGYADIFGKQ